MTECVMPYSEKWDGSHLALGKATEGNGNESLVRGLELGFGMFISHLRGNVK